MDKKNLNKIYIITRSAIYISLYIALCYVFAPISFGMVQVRIAEALCILPLFDPYAVVAITIACFLSNLLISVSLIDAIFGSIATFIGLVLIFFIKKDNFYLKMAPTVISNAIIIPFVLKYAYGINEPLWLSALTVAIGEIISVIGLGYLLYMYLNKHKELFKSR